VDNPTMSLTVVGVKDALRELNKVDKELRREITADYKQIVSAIVAEAQGKLSNPNLPSGMVRNWRTKSGYQMTPYPGAKPVRVRAFLSGKKPREFAGFTSNLATFGIRVDNATAQLYDIAGRGPTPTKAGEQLVRALTAKSGKQASRVMWPTVERGMPQVEDKIRALVDKIMQAVSRSI
jgi:hypothetical protein